jgi:hypothetical protein
MPRTLLMKEEWWPRPHDHELILLKNLNNASQDTAIIPQCFYDEGKGSASSYNAHPEHASFAATDEANCYPKSRITDFHSSLEVALTKHAIETDKIHHLKFAVMPIFMAFENDYTATEERTGEIIEDLIGMDHETTDRQGFPKFKGTNEFNTTYAPNNFNYYPTNQYGLTTTQEGEPVTFNLQTYYDALRHYQLSNKIKACTGKMKWFNLTKTHPKRVFNFFLKSKVKRMNPYTFFGIMIHIPSVTTQESNIVYANGVTTPAGEDGHVLIRNTRSYNEYNKDFNFEVV